MLDIYQILEGMLVFLAGAGIFSFINVVFCRIERDYHPLFALSGLLGGCTALLCLQSWGISLQTLCIVLFLAVLAGIALSDLNRMKIPNSFIIAAGIMAVVSAFVFPETGILYRGIGALCISLPMLAAALFIPGGFGGGDIKLMMVCGWFLGWERCIVAFAVAIVAAGIFCVCMLLVGKITRKSRFPLGPFLCLGTAVAAMNII